MSLKPLNDLSEFSKEKRVKVRADNYLKLWEELNEKDLPAELSSFINSEVDHINALDHKDQVFRYLGKSQAAILKRIKDEMGLVPANYYRNLWVGLGMAVFGVPLGVVFGLSFENMAFIGLGLPIGLAVGIGIGTSLDAKAKSEAKQLRFEV